MGIRLLITIAGDVQSFTELNFFKTGTHIAILEKSATACLVFSHTQS